MEVEMRKNPVTTKSPAEQVVKDILHKPRLLSDNGSSYMAEYLNGK
jgi:hypothetical protein